MTKKAIQLCGCVVNQITTETDKRFDLVARIADAIIETTLEIGGGAVERDLIAKGFAQPDITAHWHFANALAAIELKCRKNDIASTLCARERYA